MRIIEIAAEKGREEVTSRLLIIGNSTENIFARDEKSRIFFVKITDSRRAFLTIVGFVGTTRERESSIEEEKNTPADTLKTRVKERVGDGHEKRSAVSTFERCAGLVEKKAYMRFSCSCFLDRSHDTEHRPRNGTKRRLPRSR